MNHKEKDGSNRRIIQRKIVRYIEEKTSDKRRKTFRHFFAFFNHFINLTKKPWSNRQILQRKIVTYDRRTKNQREEQKFLPFGCFPYV